MDPNDIAVWNWVGHYLWAPLMALFGAVALILWNGLNKRIDEKANEKSTIELMQRIEKIANDALERKLFDDYIRRMSDQRLEDRAQSSSQFAKLETGQTTISDKVDKLTAIVLENVGTGRRSADWGHRP